MFGIGWSLFVLARLATSISAEDGKCSTVYDVTITQSRLGIAFGPALTVQNFAPNSALKGTTVRIGDKLVMIDKRAVTKIGELPGLLAKDTKFPKVLSFAVSKERGQVCEDDTAPHAGRLVIQTSRSKKITFEFMSSDFGGLPANEALEAVLADPLHACFGVSNNREQVKGRVVFANRGRCSFVKKIAFLHQLGAAAVVIMNNDVGLVHIPKPHGKTDLPKIPSSLVTSVAGLKLRSLLKDEANAPVLVSFQLDADVEAQWADISDLLLDVRKWPEESKQRRKLYYKLSRVHHPDKRTGSNDRFGALSKAYKIANYKMDPEVRAEYKNFDEYLRLG